MTRSLGRPRLLLMLAASAAAVITAASCSSSANENGGVNSAGASGSSTSGDSVQAQAAALIKDVVTRPTSTGVTTPVGKPIPTGKTIAWMTCSLSSCGEIASIAEDAAKLLGWKVNKINIGVTPETVKAGYQQAVRQHPDAVMSTGFDSELFQPELKQLNAMNVPVMLASVASSKEPGVTAIFISGDYSLVSGAKQADWALAQHGKNTKTLTIDVPDLKSIAGWATGFKTEYKRLCPSCTLGSVAVSSSDIGGPKIASQVSSYIQQHPDINEIQMATSSLALGLPQALKPIGSKAQIGVINADDTIRSYMRAGTVSLSNAIDWPTTVYKMFDVEARLLTNQSIAPDLDAPEKTYLFTPADIPEGSGYRTPLVEDYVAEFKKIWGISS